MQSSMTRPNFTEETHVHFESATRHSAFYTPGSCQTRTPSRAVPGHAYLRNTPGPCALGPDGEDAGSKVMLAMLLGEVRDLREELAHDRRLAPQPLRLPQQRLGLHAHTNTRTAQTPRFRVSTPASCAVSSMLGCDLHARFHGRRWRVHCGSTHTHTRSRSPGAHCAGREAVTCLVLILISKWSGRVFG